MVQAINSSSSASAYPGGSPAFASLQAQLQRFEQQLSECINCASAETPRGKADIEAISARIGQLKGRIAQADAPAPARAVAGLGGTIDVYA
jgi:hypothetical protein